MTDTELESTFATWRQRSLEDGLTLVDEVLAASDQLGQVGLQETWRDRLETLISEPLLAGTSGRMPLNVLGGVHQVSEDEINESVQGQHLMQALSSAAEASLGTLLARCSVWNELATQAGHGQAVLLTPDLIVQSLCVAVHDSVPWPPRRNELLQLLSPVVVAVSIELFEQQNAWLEAQGLGVDNLAQAVAKTPAEAFALQPMSRPLNISAAQVPALLAMVAYQSGLDTDMSRLLADLAGPIQRSLAADPTLLNSTEHSLWQFVDRLAHLAQVDRVRPVPDETPLVERLRPMVEAIHNAPAPLSHAHYARTLAHVERLVDASMTPPSDAPVNAVTQGAEERRAQLEQWMHGQISERLQHHALLPWTRDFLLGPWVQVVSRTGAVAGATATSTRHWAALIDPLISAADQSRSVPLIPAELDALLADVRDGLHGVGYAPAAVYALSEALHGELSTRTYLPSTAPPQAPEAPELRGATAASSLGTVVHGAEDNDDRASEDWMSSSWMHHGNLETVQVDLDDGQPRRRPSSQLDAWLDGLQAGDLCRMFLQGRWTTARLDWVSDRQQFYKFSRRSDTFSASRRMLARMRSEGLVTTLQPGQWLRDAVDSMPVSLP